MSAAKGAGALSGRVCGAGGGGCMTLFCEDGQAEGVREALAAEGATPLDYRIARRGLSVTVDD